MIKKRRHETVSYPASIAGRKDIIDLLARHKKPLSFKKISTLLAYKEDEDKLTGLARRLNAMERDGQLLKNRNHKYGVSAKMDLITGTVEGHTDGYGFLIPEKGGKDLYISPREMSRLMHGDRVMAHVKARGKRAKREANIVEVLKRAHRKLVAKYYIEGNLGIAVPVNPKICHEILIPPEENLNAPDNNMVLVEITRYPDKRFAPVGKVVQILGEHMAPGLEVDVALHSWGIPYEWPDEILKDESEVVHEVNPDDHRNRVDLTETPLVTIDGEDAKDFDDAVWCKKTANGWKALVAIADVSYYVAPDSNFDVEARVRGTSVYFPNFVVPMLPETLSTGICSLNPHQARLCLVCEMLFDRKGKVVSSKFYKAVMRSFTRLTYNEVGGLFGGDKKYRDLGVKHPVLWELFELYKVLRKARTRRGVIDFSTVESRIVFGENKKISKIVPQTRNNAHKLIEELMINANVQAGKFLLKHKIPGLFRVHEEPAELKVQDIREFLADFGLKLEGGDIPRPGDYAAILDGARERPEFNLIQTVLLRSLRQANYTPENKGHFGLARTVYAHFTSPIRRYPDLLVHRAISFMLAGGKVKNYQYNMDDMSKLGDECSHNERRADDATRDVISWLKCEYMQDKVGEDFNGVISSVTSFGIFVEVVDIYVEGLIHISMLPADYYHFDPVRHQLAGGNLGLRFRLGDPLRVKLVKVDLDERKIDFILAKTDDLRNPRRKSGNKKRRKRRASEN